MSSLNYKGNNYNGYRKVKYAPQFGRVSIRISEARTISLTSDTRIDGIGSNGGTSYKFANFGSVEYSLKNWKSVPFQPYGNKSIKMYLPSPDIYPASMINPDYNNTDHQDAISAVSQYMFRPLYMKTRISYYSDNGSNLSTSECNYSIWTQSPWDIRGITITSGKIRSSNMFNQYLGSNYNKALPYSVMFTNLMGILRTSPPSSYIHNYGTNNGYQVSLILDLDFITNDGPIDIELMYLPVESSTYEGGYATLSSLHDELA